MKRILSIILATVLVLSLAACAGGTDTTGSSNATNDTAVNNGTQTGQLLVGYGKADITPTESVPLQGYGETEKRMSDGIKSYMYQIAVAVTDPEGNTAIVIAADACWLEEELAKSIRDEIELECGVPADNVIISALHQHSAPDMYNQKAPSGIEYRKNVFLPGAVAAAKAAMENRAPATVQVTTVETENINFVRHYKMEDGTYGGDNFGNWKQAPVGHAEDVDNVIQLVKFVRKGQTTQNGEEAKDIILTNLQGHPHMGSGATDTAAHSDLVGVYRDEVEAQLDCHVIYFSGAGGNVNFRSRIAEENKSVDFKEHGKRIAKYVIDAEGTYTDVEMTAVKATKVSFTGVCNHTEDHRLAEATEAYNRYISTGDDSLVKKYGFESWYHAGSVISNVDLPESMTFEIFALSFGDVAFVAAPYEMFNSSGLAIKAGSPFKMTLVATIANGGQGYFPTMNAWDYGCYEQYSSSYERGTAEKLVDEYLKMLNDLYSQY